MVDQLAVLRKTPQDSAARDAVFVSKSAQRKDHSFDNERLERDQPGQILKR